MRKIKAKQLRVVAAFLYKPETPEFSRRRIYRRLKKMYSRGMII